MHIFFKKLIFIFLYFIFLYFIICVPVNAVISYFFLFLTDLFNVVFEKISIFYIIFKFLWFFLTWLLFIAGFLLFMLTAFLIIFIIAYIYVYIYNQIWKDADFIWLFENFLKFLYKLSKKYSFFFKIDLNTIIFNKFFELNPLSLSYYSFLVFVEIVIISYIKIIFSIFFLIYTFLYTNRVDYTILNKIIPLKSLLTNYHCRYFFSIFFFFIIIYFFSFSRFLFISLFIFFIIASMAIGTLLGFIKESRNDFFILLYSHLSSIWLSYTSSNADFISFKFRHKQKNFSFFSRRKDNNSQNFSSKPGRRFFCFWNFLKKLNYKPKISNLLYVNKIFPNKIKFEQSERLDRLCKYLNHCLKVVRTGDGSYLIVSGTGDLAKKKFLPPSQQGYLEDLVSLNKHTRVMTPPPIKINIHPQILEEVGDFDPLGKETLMGFNKVIYHKLFSEKVIETNLDYLNSVLENFDNQDYLEISVVNLFISERGLYDISFSTEIISSLNDILEIQNLYQLCGQCILIADSGNLYKEDTDIHMVSKINDPIFNVNGPVDYTRSAALSKIYQHLEDNDINDL